MHDVHEKHESYEMHASWHASCITWHASHFLICKSCLTCIDTWCIIHALDAWMHDMHDILWHVKVHEKYALYHAYFMILIVQDMGESCMSCTMTQLQWHVWYAYNARHA